MEGWVGGYLSFPNLSHNVNSVHTLSLNEKHTTKVPKKNNSHSSNPLTFFVLTGTPCALLYIAFPKPPYCPFPHESSSIVGIPVPSMRSTVKKARLPPALRSMHFVWVFPEVERHRTTSVGILTVSRVTVPPRPICLYGWKPGQDRRGI